LKHKLHLFSNGSILWLMLISYGDPQIFNFNFNFFFKGFVIGIFDWSITKYKIKQALSNPKIDML